MTGRGFKRIEDKVCANVKIQPRLKIHIFLSAKYVSPKGKNIYEKHREYNYEKVKALYYNVKKEIETKETFEEQKRKERNKMTDSLRYDILKRDNYRCQICGVTAKEGAKLHVDHIKPIAKGGKTQPDNLQTLCDRCNLGKSDKF
ncbi:MAG: HNH endonuclease [Lachnospiraceae bacterium]|nr:HNH endonuclease [Lachnospiraceae bacterium]